MGKHKFHVVMEYAADIEIEADTRDDAVDTLSDMIGDGIALRDADIIDWHIEE